MDDTLAVLMPLADDILPGMSASLRPDRQDRTTAKLLDTLAKALNAGSPEDAAEKVKANGPEVAAAGTDKALRRALVDLYTEARIAAAQPVSASAPLSASVPLSVSVPALVRNEEERMQLLIGASVWSTPGLVSVVVVLGFFATLGVLMFNPNLISANQFPALPADAPDSLKNMSVTDYTALVASRPETAPQIINILIGSLAAGFATVLSYWLGSSQGSRLKDAAMLKKGDETADRSAAGGAVGVPAE